ncbi:phage tail protein [Vibrio lentus]|uniref:phage tail protein n=1 Tax=Vibrio lentus TaxID=136468 RepID=UPI000C83707E|nr:phage tail protein [Vibrio lentus]PMM19540.1 hypothetical protein BCT58_19990 [Vibrio lentus]
MKALQSLTDLFKKHVVDAKNLDVWATDGVIFSVQGESVDGFEVEYTANVFIQDAKLNPADLFMHVVCWLNKYDPERQEKGLSMPMFAGEPLDKGRFDLKIKIAISEEFELEPSTQGVWKQSGELYSCENKFESIVDEVDDDLGELVHFVGHLDDLP